VSENLLDKAQKEAGLPPAPLTPFHGERPPAPGWFDRALARAPERSLTPTPRGRVEVLAWGERGKPGLLFVHGNRAHADWWSFIAPFFADDHRVAALSLAGMGGSDWRDRYDYASLADDLEAAADAAGLHEGGRKPVYIGHSFGGGVVFHAAAQHPERLGGAILIDVGFAGAGARKIAAQREKRMLARRAGGSEPRKARVYPSLAEALAHFRLSPPQPIENLFIVDYIARHALKRARLPNDSGPDGSGQDGSGEGWTWKFDPDIWEKLDLEGIQAFLDDVPRIELPLAHLYGEESPYKAGSSHRPLPDHALTAGIPEAHHHVPIDQPLALVATIRAVLAGWRA
jgi:pimeloyl-ACP methyl ester carboxylesterase